MPKLKNSKHEQFCVDYLIDLNGTQAYQRVYKKVKEATARANSARLLTNANIQQRISELKQERSERTKITADMVLKAIYDIATTDIAEIYDKNGYLKNIHKIPKKVRLSIAAIKVNELWEYEGKEKEQIGETKEIKFYDKLRALEDLGKHLKLFTDKIELSGKVESLASELNKARRRIESSKGK